MTHRPVVVAGTLIGIGMGGFVDGILFHQILQLHNMLSARLPPTSVVNIEVNMFWDGLFHGMTWLATAAGIALLWRAGQRPDAAWATRAFVGSLPFGWGLFNLVEGLIDHHLLHIHHVIERPGHLKWDLAFLLSGVAMLVVGWLLIRSSGPGASRAETISEGR